MKRRGWRVALTVATLGLALVGSLVVFNWATVRDHVEAWRFQATRETKTFHPGDRVLSIEGGDVLLLGLAVYTKCVVVGDPASLSRQQPNPWPLAPVGLLRRGRHGLQRARNANSAYDVITALREGGYRIIEQRFPRRAYVVVGYPAQPSLSIKDLPYYGCQEEAR